MMALLQGDTYTGCCLCAYIGTIVIAYVQEQTGVSAVRLYILWEAEVGHQVLGRYSTSTYAPTPQADARYIPS